jgi:hypothetical protein
MSLTFLRKCRTLTLILMPNLIIRHIFRGRICFFKSIFGAFNSNFKSAKKGKQLPLKIRLGYQKTLNFTYAEVKSVEKIPKKVRPKKLKVKAKNFDDQ